MARTALPLVCFMVPVWCAHDLFGALNHRKLFSWAQAIQADLDLVEGRYNQTMMMKQADRVESSPTEGGAPCTNEAKAAKTLSIMVNGKADKEPELPDARTEVVDICEMDCNRILEEFHTLNTALHDCLIPQGIPDHNDHEYVKDFALKNHAQIVTNLQEINAPILAWRAGNLLRATQIRVGVMDHVLPEINELPCAHIPGTQAHTSEEPRSSSERAAEEEWQRHHEHDADQEQPQPDSAVDGLAEDLAHPVFDEMEASREAELPVNRFIKRQPSGIRFSSMDHHERTQGVQAPPASSGNGLVQVGLVLLVCAAALILAHAPNKGSLPDRISLGLCRIEKKMAQFNKSKSQPTRGLPLGCV